MNLVNSNKVPIYCMMELCLVSLHSHSHRTHQASCPTVSQKETRPHTPLFYIKQVTTFFTEHNLWRLLFFMPLSSFPMLIPEILISMLYETWVCQILQGENLSIQWLNNIMSYLIWNAYCRCLTRLNFKAKCEVYKSQSFDFTKDSNLISLNLVTSTTQLRSTDKL